MPTFRHGRDTAVFIGAYDVTTFFRDASLAHAVDLAETSTYGTFDKTYVVGMRDAKWTLSGLFDGTTDAVDQILSTILGQAAAVVATYAPEGTTIGRRTYIMQAEETTHEVSSPLSDVVATNAELQASGGSFAARALHALGAETTTGNDASVDNAALTSFGAAAALHVTANTRDAGSIVVKVQHSVDDAVWVDLITFASVGFGVETSEFLSVAGTVNRYLRTTRTVTGGATGSYTYTVSCARKNI